MARAIDSEAAYRFLSEQLVKETGAFSKGVNKGLNIARSAMRNPDAIHTLTQPNEPLTLEQLREMDGKPVWVKVIGKTGIRCDGWCEVEIREKDPFAYVWWPGSEVEDIAKIEDYGKTWACYAYQSAQIDREGWISVEERLPEDEKDGETVLVIIFGKPHENITLHGAIMTAGYFRDEGWVLNEYPEWEGPEVTHWMPLPEPPAELEKRMGVR